MRRTLLLLTMLAAPVVASAQATPSAGQVTFDNAFIGAEGCSSTASTQHYVRMAWFDQLDGTNVATGGVFRILASNTAPPTTGARYCPDTNPNATSGPIYTGKVGDDIPNNAMSMSGVAEAVKQSEITTAAGYGACTKDNVTIYICVQFYPYDVGTNQPKTTPTAWAVGQMSISLTRPATATLDKLLPGDGALNVYFSGSAAKYKIRALSMRDPTALPDGSDFDPASAYSAFDPRDTRRHESGFVTGSPYRWTGFVNYVPYAVTVIAYTAAETPGDPSNVRSVEPMVVSDFWEEYRADGGRETGGCSTGYAGPLGLAVLALTLAALRRRK